MITNEELLAKDDMLWTNEGRKRILALMGGARTAAIHQYSEKAAELSDCSGTFIADQLRDLAFDEQNKLNG